MLRRHARFSLDPRDRDWNSIETNQFGTNEFIEWCKLVGTEPLLGFNAFAERPAAGAATLQKNLSLKA
jgi:alpha-L-arabinofuranosidase